MSERGKYIVIEGQDGTGKSTQVETLAQILKEQGIDSYIAHEPAGTPMADEIRSIIKNGEIARDGETNLLLFTAARHEIWQKARRHLESGDYVLSARNYLSTLAYQGYGEGVDKNLILETTEKFTGPDYMQPDTTVILSLDDESRLGRIQQRGELAVPDNFESREQDFQDRVNQAYVQIAKERDYPIIDANQSIRTISAKICQIAGIKYPESPSDQS